MNQFEELQKQLEARRLELLDFDKESDDNMDVAELLILNEMLCSTDNWKRNFGGSKRGKKANIDRNHAEAYQRLWKDYFDENPTYNDKQFRRRFKMRKNIFFKILDGITDVDVYFTQDVTAREKWEFRGSKR